MRSARGCAVRVIACDVGEAASARALARRRRAATPSAPSCTPRAVTPARNMHARAGPRRRRRRGGARRRRGGWQRALRGVAARRVRAARSAVAAAFAPTPARWGLARAANAYLDALARGRRAHGLAARSAQLPLVGGAGMGAAACGGRQQRYRGMAAIALDEYAASVRVLLARPEAGGGLALTVRAALAAQRRRARRVASALRRRRSCSADVPARRPLTRRMARLPWRVRRGRARGLRRWRGCRFRRARRTSRPRAHGARVRSPLLARMAPSLSAPLRRRALNCRSFGADGAVARDRGRCAR